MGSRSANANEQFLAEKTCLGMPEDTAVSCARIAEQIEMLFDFWTWVGRMKRRRCDLMSNYFNHLLFQCCDWRVAAISNDTVQVSALHMACVVDYRFCRHGTRPGHMSTSGTVWINYSSVVISIGRDGLISGQAQQPTSTERIRRVLSEIRREGSNW